MYNFGSLKTLLAAGGLALAMGVGTAGAVTVNDYDLVFTGDGPPPPGVNDCAGDLGTPPNCTWNGSPMIAKFDFNDAGQITNFTSGLFGSIDGSEFTFDFSSGFKWTYTPNDGTDPGITAFSVKGGNTYNVWEKAGPAYLAIGDFSDNWYPPAGGLSHIVFYDSIAPIPLPAAGWLLLTALGGLGAAGLRRRRKDA